MHMEPYIYYILYNIVGVKQMAYLIVNQVKYERRRQSFHALSTVSQQFLQITNRT